MARSMLIKTFSHPKARPRQTLIPVTSAWQRVHSFILICYFTVDEVDCGTWTFRGRRKTLRNIMGQDLVALSHVTI